MMNKWRGMDRTYSTHGGDEYCVQNLRTKILIRLLGRPRRRWEDIDWILKKSGMVWIHLVEDRNQLQAFVNTVMNLWIPYKAWNSLSDYQLHKKESATRN